MNKKIDIPFKLYKKNEKNNGGYITNIVKEDITKKIENILNNLNLKNNKYNNSKKKLIKASNTKNFDI